jgi:hypothetical protein
MKRCANLFYAFVFLSCFLVSSLSADEIKWGTPAMLSLTGYFDSSDPQIGIDVQGNGVAIWVENRCISGRNYINGIWSSITNINNANATDPRLIVDTNGNAVAIWIENGVVRTSAQPFNDKWSSSVALSTSGSSAPEMNVDAVGNVVAVWINNGVIQSSTKLLNQSWQAVPDTLSSAGAYYPQVAMGANGTVVATWYQEVDGVDTIYAATKTISETWDPPIAISTPSINSIYPEVAVDASGNALIIWFRYDIDSKGVSYSNVVLQWASLPSGAIWTKPIDLSNGGISDPYNLNAYIGFDFQGNAIATWNQSFDGSCFCVQAAIKKNNGNWGAVRNVEGGNIYTHFFSLDINARGDAFLGFMEKDPASSLIQVGATKSYIPSRNSNMWYPNTNVSYKTSNSGYPQIATSNRGNTLYGAMVWVSNIGAHNVVQASMGTGIALLPPVNLSVIQGMNDMGLFREYYNTLSWKASPSPSVQGYSIFRNGEFVSTTNAQIFTLIDHNRVEGESVTYGISSLDYSVCYEESEQAMVSLP